MRSAANISRFISVSMFMLRGLRVCLLSLRIAILSSPGWKVSATTGVPSLGVSDTSVHLRHLPPNDHWGPLNEKKKKPADPSIRRLFTCFFRCRPKKTSDLSPAAPLSMQTKRKKCTPDFLDGGVHHLGSRFWRASRTQPKATSKETPPRTLPLDPHTCDGHAHTGPREWHLGTSQTPWAG